MTQGDRAARIELIHATGIEMAELGLALAENWKQPYVLTIDRFLPPSTRLRTSRRWCRMLVATGTDLKCDLVGSFGVPTDLVSVVAPGIGLPAGQACPQASGRVPVVGAAWFSPADRGLTAFLDAARRVLDAGVDVEFVLADLGREETEARRLAEHFRLSPRLTYVDGGGGAIAFWKALDLFCHVPSSANTGRPVLQAMAHGVAVIASDVAGLRGLLQHGHTGVLVPPGNPEVLAGALLKLLDDRALRQSLGARGRDRVAAEFTPAREAEALADLYRRILASTKPTTVGFGAAPKLAQVVH
jgi:glycosyltransferase involved in cell wall biosynthesis